MRPENGIKTVQDKQHEKLTPDQILEIAKCKFDVIYFIETYVKVQHPTKGSLPLKLFDFQEKAVNNLRDFRNNILLFSRQMGKTTITAAYILWFALFHKDKTTLITAHNQKGAVEILDRIKYAYKELPRFLQEACLEYNKLSIVLDNGSKVVCRATGPDSARGLSPSLVYSDEVEFIRPSIMEAFYTALRPTLSTGGSMIMSSTPSNDDSLFAQLWKGANDTLLPNGETSDVGSNGFKASYAIYSDHPDRGPEFAKEEIAAMGLARFQREHECKFVSLHETLVEPLALARLKDRDPVMRTGEVRWFRKVDYNSSYYISLDPSLGTESDWAAIEIFEVPSIYDGGEIVQAGEWSSNTTSPKNQVSLLLDICDYIACELDLDMEDEDLPIYWSFENNGIGASTHNIIMDTGIENFPGRLISDKRVGKMNKNTPKGLNTTNKNKLLGCTKLKSLVESDRIILNSRGLISQLKNFGPKGSSYAARSGHDDLVMAMVMIVRMMELSKTWDVFDANILKDDVTEGFREPLPIIF